MTTKAPCTQAQIRRTIKAATAEGLRVVGIRPDGTLLVQDGDNPWRALAPSTDKNRKWEDVEA